MAVDTEVLAALRVDVERTRNQFKVCIAQCCGAMDITDLASSAAANHCPANRLIYNFFTVNHDKFSYLKYFIVSL